MANQFKIIGGSALNGATSGTITVKAADATTDYTIKWPAAQGGASTVLTNDASGNLSWAASGGTSPSETYFNGYMGSATSWTTTTTGSFVDGTNAGGNSLTTVYSNGITVTAGGSNVAGITFTPTSNVAAYKITAKIAAWNSGLINASGATYQLTDGTTVFSWDMVLATGAGSSVTERICVMGGVYVPGTTSPVTVKIQIKSLTAATSAIGSAAFDSTLPSIQWEVVQLKA